MKTLYSMTCTTTGETQQVVVCAQCAAKMPLVNGDDVKAESADADCACEFCGELSKQDQHLADLLVLRAAAIECYAEYRYEDLAFEAALDAYTEKYGEEP